MLLLPRNGWLATITVTLGAASLLAPAAAQAVTLSQLAPGASYRYVFTSSGERDAASPDIAVYNAFVTSQASQNSALAGIAFSAIGSTATVNATDNVSCGTDCDAAPIFTLDGTEVAGSLAQLFSGSLLSTLAVDQFGSRNFAYVFTGSQSNGNRSASPLGAVNATIGLNEFTAAYYIDGQATVPTASSYSIYGLSGALQVAGTAVPEPASLALLGAGLLGLGLVRRRHG